VEKIILFLSGIRWQDVLDIFLNGYILFRLYVLFRGTNAFRVLMGVAGLWFLQRISVSLGLVVTSWFVQGIIALAALIIIVIFRNEIRAVLQAKNLRSIFWGFPRAGAQTPVEILVDSAFELARRRIGALIVLPGNEDLSEAAHGGIRWQGLVSKEMILSIFWPENPVHDGAIVIDGNVVIEAGAILPLSHRQDLPSFYGTRHRAAAGLAEATDALVIVISEERGSISIAKGQNIRNVEGKEELAWILQRHLGIPVPAQGELRKEKIELSAAALVSFLFIAGVWLSFTQGQDTLVTLDIPVEFMRRDPGFEIIDTSANAVRVELSGSLTLLRFIRPEQVKVQVDLSKGAAGANAISITPKEVSLPPGVSLRSVMPPVVDVTLDKVIRKDLPVQVDWAGKMEPNLHLTQVKVSPERIQVTGPKEILDNRTTLYTEKVYVDNLEKSGSLTAQILFSPASLKPASGARDRVVVEFTVKERDLQP
jgi:diadenylate cyclase